jgi:hypothetical protein
MLQALRRAYRALVEEDIRTVTTQFLSGMLSGLVVGVVVAVVGAIWWS